MITVKDKDNGKTLGTLTEDQLKFLQDQLEEEFEADADYYINTDTVDSFAETGADPELIDKLRQWLGTREEMEIQWSTP